MIGSTPGALLRARDLVDPALREGVARLSSEIRRVAAYHLGFVDADGHPASGHAGKALRPALAFLSAEAAGAPPEVALPGAAAVEMVHNFSLLHDDVMDGDAERRHRPTAWALFGIGEAIIAGDALLTLAYDYLIEDGRAERVRATAALAEATARMIAGQGEDLAFESRMDVTTEECLRMSAHKTGALMSCAASIGAILAGSEGAPVRALAEFGLHLGQAFQAVDDLLGIWGRVEVTGKPVASDLSQHKKTLPVVAALSVPGPRRDRLAALLSNGQLDEEQLALAAELIEESGGRRRCLDEAERELRDALGALDRGGVGGRPRRELEEVAAFVTAREF